MRIAVIGATGRTGRLVVEEALRRGHEVAATARRPEALPIVHERLEVFRADVLERGSLRSALAGVDATISAIGVGTARSPTDTYSRGVEGVLAAMASDGATALIVVSAAPAAPRDEQPFVERRLVMPILDRLFGETYEDMRRMESILRGQDRPWVSVRPPRLIDRKATGSYRISTEPLRGGRSIRCGDLASALLDVIDRDGLLGEAVYVSG